MKIPTFKEYVVVAEFSFSYKAFLTALKWGRKKKFTYERDGEWGALLVEAYSSGVISLEDIIIKDEESYDF